MYLGKIVEIAPKATIFAAPHPSLYRDADALGADRSIRASATRFSASNDDVPSAIDKPSGCAFHTRCPLATDRLQDRPSRR